PEGANDSEHALTAGSADFARYSSPLVFAALKRTCESCYSSFKFGRDRYTRLQVSPSKIMRNRHGVASIWHYAGLIVRIIALEEPCLGVGWARRFCYALGEGVSNDPRGASVLAQILTLLSMIPVVVSRHCLLHKLAASGLYP
ncbi:hypothetical protein Moror_2239, partial [Moniliophthora roreri MCA 2997]